MSYQTEHQNADERLAPSAHPTGTNEWAERTANVATGCAHGCLYCYAREMALRFGRIPNGAAWTRETIAADRLARNPRGGRGRIMLPSAHDITPATAAAVATMAAKLLAAPTPTGKDPTRLILVTKADGPSVETVCKAIDPAARHRVQWRLTIGALDDKARKFWEPHAPAVDMRLEVLRWLFRTGWNTSVSAEPLLEPRRAVALVTTVAPSVTETIWIGAARDLARRTAWTAAAGIHQRTLARAIANLEPWHTPGGVLAVAQMLRDELAPDVWPKVRFKDSYSSALERFSWTFDRGRPVETQTRPPKAEAAAPAAPEARP